MSKSLSESYESKNEYAVGVDQDTHKTIAPDFKAKTSDELLSGTPILKAFFSPSDSGIITVDKSDSLFKAYKLLMKHNFNSLPVLDKRKQTFEKFIDLQDFVHLITTEYTFEQISNENFPSELQKSFEKRTVNDVCNVSQRNTWYPIDKNAPVRLAMETMVKRRLYRIPVMEGSTVVHITTQTDIVRFIHENIGLFPKSSLPLSKLGLGFKPVISVAPETTAFEGFKRLSEEKKGGLAVILDNGEIFGNISASDLRRLRGDLNGIRLLCLPLSEFLRPQEGQEYSPVCVTPETTLEETIAKLVLTHRHRVFLIDPSSKNVLGIISLTDIISFVIS